MLCGVTKENCQYLKSFKVNAVDTSGAGDAFIGCFASCYVKNNDVMLSMKEASAFAALSVTKKVRKYHIQQKIK